MFVPFKKSNQGISLMSVVIATAVMSIVLVSAVKINENHTRSTKTYYSRADLEEMRARVRIGIDCGKTLIKKTNQCAYNSSFVVIARNGKELVKNNEKMVYGIKLRTKCTGVTRHIDIEYELSPGKWRDLFEIPFYCKS